LAPTTPDVAVPPSAEGLGREAEALCLAARVATDEAAQGRLRELLAGDVDWDHLWRLGHIHEVLPLLATTISALGAVDVPDAWSADAQRRRSATLLQNRSLLGELLAALDAMTAAGVEAIPVKGLVLTEMFYGNLALRPAGDIDVLVRPRDLPAARDALRGLGYAQEAVPAYEERHHPFHDAPYYRPGPFRQTPLELHHGLSAPRQFRMDAASLWERSVTAELFGRRLRVLGPEDTLLHLAVHRARAPLRLRWLVDIAELMRRSGAALDVGFLLAQARAIGARTTLSMTLELSERLLGAPVPPALTEGLAIGSLKHGLLERTCGVRAMFASTDADDDRQQPHLTYRIFEEDGPLRIGRSLVDALVRKGDKWRDRRQTHSA
jgi:putative nucleotidyltransferase-like protein